MVYKRWRLWLVMLNVAIYRGYFNIFAWIACYFLCLENRRKTQNKSWDNMVKTELEIEWKILFMCGDWGWRWGLSVVIVFDFINFLIQSNIYCITFVIWIKGERWMVMVFEYFMWMLLDNTKGYNILILFDTT